MLLTELISYLDGFLDSPGAEDFGPNGLQVDGRPDVKKLVTGVSACHQLFVAARERGGDAILVHHGLLWRGGANANPQPLTGIHYRRIAELVKHDLGLIAYHLPLDRHPEVGNNAVAMRALGVHHDLTPFAEFGGAPVGFHGELPQTIDLETLVGRCEEVFHQRPLAVGDGPGAIARIGIVSGGGESVLYEAIELGLDAYITGEIKEWVMNVAREAGVHYLAAGHYATERLGILALGEHLEERFGLEVEFVDVPNPV
jgi:dinuclear metal center YbgI/SA1388 family protein